MNFDTKTSVTLLGADLRHYAFMSEIERVYIGYRQCYSKNPLTAPKYDMVAIKKAFLADRAEMFYDLKIARNRDEASNMALDALTSGIQLFGLDKICQHLHRCQFITRHSGHQSPTEHAQFTFVLDGIDRSCSHQFVRHRIASYSHQSQRYVTETDPDVITPPSIRKNPQAFAIYKEYLSQFPDYAAKIRALGDPAIKEEDIRYLYPNALTSGLTFSMNIRSLNHFFNERCCTRAQWAIRGIANDMLRQLRLAVPFIFSQSGPKCKMLHYCPEHESCGKALTWEQIEAKMKKENHE